MSTTSPTHASYLLNTFTTFYCILIWTDNTVAHHYHTCITDGKTLILSRICVIIIAHICCMESIQTTHAWSRLSLYSLLLPCDSVTHYVTLSATNRKNVRRHTTLCFRQKGSRTFCSYISSKNCLIPAFIIFGKNINKIDFSSFFFSFVIFLFVW